MLEPVVVRIESGIGGGSGVIVSRVGLVLTNNHVFGSTSTATVTLKDGEQYVGAVQLQMQWLITSLNQWLGHEPAAAEARLPAMQTPVQSEIVVGARD